MRAGLDEVVGFIGFAESTGIQFLTVLPGARQCGPASLASSACLEFQKGSGHVGAVPDDMLRAPSRQYVVTVEFLKYRHRNSSLETGLLSLKGVYSSSQHLLVLSRVAA